MCDKESIQDQLYGILAACVKYVDLISDVPDLISTLISAMNASVDFFNKLLNNNLFPLTHRPVRKIRSILDRIQIRKWIGPHATLNVEFITACRPWKDWFLGWVWLSHLIFNFFHALNSVCRLLAARCRLDRNLPVRFQGGMKTDVDGHHAFVFIRRAGPI